VFDNVPLAVVEVPSPILSVPPVINFRRPQYRDGNAGCRAVRINNRDVAARPVDCSRAAYAEDGCAGASAFVAFGSTLKLPPLIMSCVAKLLGNETAPSIFSVPPVIVKCLSQK